jgi:hypothetical membrane protein
MGVATASVLAPLAFWSAVAVASVLRPGYDQTVSTISRLSVGENAAVMNAGFLAYGILTVAISFVLRGRVERPLDRMALALLALSGACTASLGVQWLIWSANGAAPVSARPALTADPLYDIVHSVLAAGSFAFSGLGSFVLGISVRRRPGWSGYDVVFIALALVVMVLSTYLSARLPEAQGLAQRVAVVALQAWVAVLAFRLHALGRLPWPTNVRDEDRAAAPADL